MENVSAFGLKVIENNSYCKYLFGHFNVDKMYMNAFFVQTIQFKARNKMIDSKSKLGHSQHKYY